MYISPEYRPSVSNYKYKSDMFGMVSIIVPKYDVDTINQFITLLL